MFRRTWGLAKSSMTVIRLDRELLVLPVLNAVAAVIFALLLWLVASGLGVDFYGDSDSDGGIGIIVLVVFALIGMNVINTFFKGALVAGAHERFTGGDPTIGSSLSGASARLHRLVPWALMATTVGIILSIVERQGGQFGRIARGMFDMAWGVITFLIVPVVMFDPLGGRINIMADRCADAFNFIGCYRRTNATTADHYSTIVFSIRYTFS